MLVVDVKGFPTRSLAGQVKENFAPGDQCRRSGSTIGLRREKLYSEKVFIANLLTVHQSYDPVMVEVSKNYFLSTFFFQLSLATRIF